MPLDPWLIETPPSVPESSSGSSPLSQMTGYASFPLLKKVMSPPGPIFMLVMEEGKWGVALLWLRCRQMPPSKTTLKMPLAELTKLRISRTAPSARRRFVVMPPPWTSFLKFEQATSVPLPVMTKLFVVAALDVPLPDWMFPS